MICKYSATALNLILPFLWFFFYWEYFQSLLYYSCHITYIPDGELKNPIKSVLFFKIVAPPVCADPVGKLLLWVWIGTGSMVLASSWWCQTQSTHPSASANGLFGGVVALPGLILAVPISNALLWWQPVPKPALLTLPLRIWATSSGFLNMNL